MYTNLDYIKRGLLFANNLARPKHKKLSTLMIYATDLCDSGCKHCLIWAKRPVKHLSFEDIVKIMGNKCITKDTLVGLEGGEFLLHPEGEKILEWFSKNHKRFDILSNCLKPENVIDAVKKYSPNRLYVSLDGNKETYEYMRGRDGYDNVLKVIEACKDIVPISAMFTLSPYNDFNNLNHVIGICDKYKIDVRVGIYNDIGYFDTVEKAHETEIGESKNNTSQSFSEVKANQQEKSEQKKKMLSELQYQTLNLPKHDESKLNFYSDFQKLIPESIKSTSENFDFLLLYDEWRRKNTRFKCYSILDSIVIHPNGDVPICQNLDLKLGNIHNNTLDEVINSAETNKTHKEYVHNCNQCWVNFHRKYDIVMLRTLEKFLPKKAIQLVYGKYQWCADKNMSYKAYMKKFDL